MMKQILFWLFVLLTHGFGSLCLVLYKNGWNRGRAYQNSCSNPEIIVELLIIFFSFFNIVASAIKQSIWLIWFGITFLFCCLFCKNIVLMSSWFFHPSDMLLLLLLTMSICLICLGVRIHVWVTSLAYNLLIRTEDLFVKVKFLLVEPVFYTNT